MTARLRLQEFLARAGDRVNQGTRQGVGDAIGGLDRLGAEQRRQEQEQRRQEQKQLLAAKLTAAGIMGGTNPAAPRTVDRPGTVKMTRPETLEEKADRFFKTVGKDMPSVQRDLGEGGVRGLLAQAQGSQVDAARVRNIDAGTAVKGAQLATEGERTKKVTADTAGKVQKTAVDGLEKSVGIIRSEIAQIEDVDVDGLSELVEIQTEQLQKAFPDAKPDVVRGMVANAVYEEARKNAKDQSQRDKLKWDKVLAKAKYDAARKDAKTRSLTTQEINGLASQRNSVKKLKELKALSESPAVRAEWRNFSQGANEIALVTGDFVKGVINLEEYEAAQRKLDAKLQGKGATKEFLRRMRSDLFTVARAKNGPGVMTDADFRFWLPTLVDPSMTPEGFDNAMSRLLEVSTREYTDNISIFGDIARTLSKKFVDDANMSAPRATIKTVEGPAKDPFAGIKTVVEAKARLGGLVESVDITNPTGNLGEMISGSAATPTSGNAGGTSRAFTGANIPIANNLAEATAIEAQARQTVLNIRENPSAYSKEETAAASHNFNRATQQRKNMSGGQLGNIAGPSASTLGPRVDALRKKIQGN